MNVREYSDDDFERVKALHHLSGFGYALPAFSSKEFFSRRVVSDESGVAMAAFLRRSAEAFLICNPNWRNPAWRMEALRQLHGVSREDAAENNIAEVNAFLPPDVAKRFGRRLSRLGWQLYDNAEWKCYSFEVR